MKHTCIDEQVVKCLQDIFSADPNHKFLVDNTKARSLADPWVIAHALRENAIVVTKEEKVTALNSTKIKIPNVCEKMKVDFEKYSPEIQDFVPSEFRNLYNTHELILVKNNRLVPIM